MLTIEAVADDLRLADPVASGAVVSSALRTARRLGAGHADGLASGVEDQTAFSIP